MGIRAFSLIEVVMAIGIMAMLAAGGSLILTSTLRGAKKARAQALVRGEGTNALNVIVSGIKYAERVTSCAGGAVAVLDVNNRTVTYACTVSGTDKYLARSGVRLTSNSVAVVDCTAVFSCDFPPPDTKSVSVNFRLLRAGADLLTEETAAMGFETTAVLRNQEF